MVNPRDDEAFRRIVNYPARGIGDTTVLRIARLAAERGVSMWEAVDALVAEPVSDPVQRTIVRKVAEFVALIRSLSLERAQKGLYDFGMEVASRSGILALYRRENTGAEIKTFLENDKFNSSIYIMLDTLVYLKKGGRITPAAAAIGSLLKLKPVLTIQGEKLDAFSKARTVSQGKQTMISAIRKDMETRFGGATPENIWLEIAYTKDLETALQFKEELLKEFPEFEIVVQPLSLSVACHIGPGSLAVACCKKIRKEV